MSLINTELSGAEFNKIYKDTKFYKFLNDNLTHYDFEYKLGLNVDTLPFNPIGYCSEGGLYFCEKSKCRWFWNQYGTKLAFIEIPDNARIYVEEDKFKSDKIVITKITNFEDVFDDFWINILQKDGCALYYVKEQTEKICKLAIQYDARALKYAKEQTEEICKLAVQQNGTAILYVKNQTEELCKLAVQTDGYALQYVKNQTEELCKLAVQQNGTALQFVKEQTAEICILAIQQSILALQFMKNK